MADYVNGDNARVKDLWQEWQNPDTYVYFSSISIWLRKIVPLCLVLGLTAGTVLFVFAVAGEGLHGKPVRWGLNLSMAVIPVVFTLAMALPLSYYASFCKPNRIARDLKRFMEKYLPDAVVIDKIWPTYANIAWRGVPMSVVLDSYIETDDRGKQSRQKRVDVFMCFAPEGESPFEENREFHEQLYYDIAAYAVGKPASKHIILGHSVLYWRMDCKELERSQRNGNGRPTDENGRPRNENGRPTPVGDSLDMMVYFSERFHLRPMSNWQLSLAALYVQNWLDYVLQRDLVPTSAKSLCFRVARYEQRYYAELHYLPVFDAQTTEWVSSEPLAAAPRPYALWDARPPKEVLSSLGGICLDCLAPKFDAGELPAIEGFAVCYAQDDEAFTLLYSRKEGVHRTQTK